MGTSPEDVLLRVSNVKFKKGNGSLYLMGESLGWMAEKSKTFTFTYKYCDIKSIKISSEGKTKVQGQLVLPKGGPVNLHFANPSGLEQQLKDRDTFKDMCQNLLQKFRTNVSQELQDKNKALVENPALLELYKELVIGRVISAEEFWTNHAPQFMTLVKGKNAAVEAAPAEQAVGVSGAFLADVRPETDGCNGIQYKLTNDIIDAVFRTYPAVKKKHAECVPNKMSEAEFWKKFFQSHYFHRDRLAYSNTDVFADCTRRDERDFRKELNNVEKNPLLDIRNFKDKTTGEGFGENSAGNETNLPAATAAHRSMIRRFNHHSMMVLKTCQKHNDKVIQQQLELLQPQGQKDEPVVNGTKRKRPPEEEPTTNGAEDNREKFEKVRKQLQESIEREDLEGQEYSVYTNAPKVDLNVQRYVHGGNEFKQAEGNLLPTSAEHIQWCDGVKRELVSTWPPMKHFGSATQGRAHVVTVISPSVAWNALRDITASGGAYRPSTSGEAIYNALSPEMRHELTNINVSLMELLRHFWSCFPAKTPDLQAKACRMKDTLDRFFQLRIRPFEDKVKRDHVSPREVTKHLTVMLDAAYEKYNQWQQRMAAAPPKLR